jgi:hypothetical protein
MNEYCYNLSGWFTTSGSHVGGMVPSGTLCFRTANLTPSGIYGTGYVSISAGSFKRSGESANWYGDSPKTRDAEAPASGNSFYEVWKLMRDTPVFDAYSLPSEYLSGVAVDGALESPDCYVKSWGCLDLLAITQKNFQYSGVCFPSRRTKGTVFVFNPKMVPMELLYTGKYPPSGTSWN